MIGYTTVGTNDLPRAKRFYAPLLAQIGYQPWVEDDFVASWAAKDDPIAARFYVCCPFDEQPATIGNGSMTAFRAQRARDVDALHQTALDGGGQDEGAPGFRPESYGETFYVGYVRDPDGNKLAFYCDDGKANP